MRKLEDEFTAAMFDIYRRAKAEADYPATKFLAMLMQDGGSITAKRLINSDKPSDGYTALFERSRLDLTVEALIVEDGRWHSLFDPAELGQARARLRAYGYEAQLR